MTIHQKAEAVTKLIKEHKGKNDSFALDMAEWKYDTLSKVIIKKYGIKSAKDLFERVEEIHSQIMEVRKEEKAKIEAKTKVKEEGVEVVKTPKKEVKQVQSFDLYTRYTTFINNAKFKHFFDVAPSFLEWFLIYRNELLTTTAIHKGNLKDAWHATGDGYSLIEGNLKREVQDSRYREVIAEMQAVPMKEEWLKSAPAKLKKEIMKDFKGITIKDGKLKISAEVMAKMAKPEHSVIRTAKIKFQEAKDYWEAEAKKGNEYLLSTYSKYVPRGKSEIETILDIRGLLRSWRDTGKKYGG